MLKRMFRGAVRVAALLAFTMPLAYAQSAPAAKAAAPAAKAATPARKQASFDASGCFGCHAPVKEFHDAGKHKCHAQQEGDQG